MKVLKEIEKDKGILDLKYKGIAIWPVLRLKCFYKIQEQDKGTVNRTRKLSINFLSVIIKSLCYGTIQLFKLSRYDYLVFSSSERRKRYDNLYHERVVEGLLGATKSLLIENPFPLGKHYKKSEIPTKNIISESILFVGIFILGFFGYKKNRLENEQIILDIQKEYGFKINYNRFLLIFEGQYRLIKVLFKYYKKPKAVFFVYSGSSMGYIKAFKEFNVPVIEVQHGVVNKGHNAYNIYNDFGELFFPDYMLTYGKREKEVFKDPDNYFINPKKVIPVGYYMLDAYLSSSLDNQKNYFASLRKSYKKIVVYSHQEIYEKEILDFLFESAAISQSVLYLLVPRIDLKEYPDEMPKNVVVERRLNIYDCLGFADIHATIVSTCAIESLCFGVPNVMYNYKNWSKFYYGDVLGDEKHTIFVESPYEFVHGILNHNFESKEYITAVSEKFFKRNFNKNVESFIEQELNS